jgi:fatty acyl-CoA reductase
LFIFLQEFSFDVRRIEWDSYFRDFVIGVKKYLLKEDPSDLTAAKRRFKRSVLLDEKV